MVYSKLSSFTGTSKRPAAALHKAPLNSDVEPPFKYYAVIYLDHEGNVQVDESAYFHEKKSTIFTPKVCQNFLEILGEPVGFDEPIDLISDGSPPCVRRRCSNAPGSETRLADGSSDSDGCSSIGSNNMVSLRIGDNAEVLDYYKRALKHFQQFNCRKVAKAFIKTIEPGKQVRHPYNGGKPPAGSAPGTLGDPEKTKPEWWPQGVMHKEPDHLRKEYRIELLLHIIRKLGSHNITADKLEKVAGTTTRSLKHPSHVGIIYEILRVRKMEERFERGEVDASTVVYVMNKRPRPKDNSEEGSGEATVPGPTSEAPEPIEEGLLTRISSIEQVAARLTTPPDTMSMAPTRSPQTSFSIPQPPPFSFDGLSQDWPYYATPFQYIDSFSQRILSNPVTAEVISPQDASAFGSSTPHLFPIATPEQKYDALPPTFRQTLSRPVDYNALALTHSLPQPTMYNCMPLYL